MANFTNAYLDMTVTDSYGANVVRLLRRAYLWLEPAHLLPCLRLYPQSRLRAMYLGWCWGQKVEGGDYDG